ncbi:MAG: ketol-acid reductoisomerase [Candidatus Diapherotrites archaeon]
MDKTLKKKLIAVFGFGSQGKAQALNLRDSGFKVIVGARKNHASWKEAEKNKFKVYSFNEAAEKAEIIMFLISDPAQKKVFNSLKKEFLEGKTICFSSGYAIAFRQIIPPKNCDAIMVTPVATGKKLRESFNEKKKPMQVFGLIGAKQNSSGKAVQTAKALANAMGLTKVFEISFEEEALANLFCEQAFLAGGMIELGKNVFMKLIKAKVSPETAYLYTFKEINLLADLLSEFGIEGTYSRISDTAEFGSRKNASKLFGKEFQKNLSKIRKEIISGKFSEQWQKEFNSGKKKLKKMRSIGKNSLIEKTAKKFNV